MSAYIVFSASHWSLHQHANKVQHYFSSERYPTLCHALPAIEELQMAWESKRNTPCFYIYKDAIDDGFEKLKSIIPALTKSLVTFLH